MARELVARLDWNKRCPPAPEKPFKEPVYDSDDLLGIVPTDYRKPYDVREVIARIVDGSDFSDFKPRYGVSTVCAQAEVYGQPCGIIGNNGPIDPDGRHKGRPVHPALRSGGYAACVSAEHHRLSRR